MRPNTVPRKRPIQPAGLLIAAALAAALTAGLAAAGEVPEADTPDRGAPGTGTPAAETPSAGTPARETPNAESTLPRTAVSTGPGLMAFVDPRTGELTDQPTREQIEALSESLKSALSRSTDGLEAFDLAGGGRGVHLAGRFRAATVARRQADGSWGLVCVDRPEEAAAAVDPPAPAPVWEER
jgi:hypothetical protein